MASLAPKPVPLAVACLVGGPEVGLRVRAGAAWAICQEARIDEARASQKVKKRSAFVMGTSSSKIVAALSRLTAIQSPIGFSLQGRLRRPWKQKALWVWILREGFFYL
jgi:hypothetical protein